MTILSTDSIMSDLDSRKALGRAHLNADRLEDALAVYSAILREYPEDIETHLFLGDCYLAGGDSTAARQFYESARKLDPKNPEIRNRILLAERMPAVHDTNDSSTVPTHPAAIARLLQRITGRNTPVSDEEVARAARMLEDIIHHPQPAQEVARRLEEIDALLPALLELNIRQARADGRPELVHALEDLLHYIDLQVRIRREGLPQPQMEELIRRGSKSPDKPKVLFLVPSSGEIGLRSQLIFEALESRGLQPALASSATLEDLQSADVVLVHNPHTSVALMETLAMCTGARVPVVVDLGGDYAQMPVDDPQYAELGLATSAAARAYTAALQLANAITVPSRLLADSLRAGGRKTTLLPDGWSRRNELWQKKSTRRSGLHIGWLGSVGSLEDVQLVRRAVVRILREFPQTQLVIGGNPQAYQLFDSIPEARRMYLPPSHADDYPYVLGQFDIVLVPLRHTIFSESCSDLPLVHAGVKGIPWVASPLPSFADWGAGGLLAASVDEWHLHLRTLVLDESLRSSLAEAGREKARTREVTALADSWERLIEETARPHRVSER